LLSAIGALDEKLECVMLFGHNPEFTGEVGPTRVLLDAPK